MPTFARALAALLWAGLAWYVSQFLIEPRFEEGFDAGLFAEVNAVVGLLCGWMIMGPRAGIGFVTSMGIGFTTSAMTVFWSLFAHSFYEMILRSLQKQYDGPVEAVIAVFELGVESLVLMSTIEIWGVLLIGGMVAGVACFVGAKTYR